MKLNLKAATVTLAFSLLTACGGGEGNGGGTASLDNSRLPGSANLPEIKVSTLQLNDEIGHTVLKQDNLVYFSLSRLDPQINELQNRQSPSPARTAALLSNDLTDEHDDSGGDNDPEPKDLAFDTSPLDWYQKDTFAPDLIKFVGVVEKSDKESLNEDPNLLPGYIRYSTQIPVSFNGEPIELGIFGIRNNASGKEFILFDQYGGLVSGGSQLSGIPSGQHTYKGYNFFRYTIHKDNPYEGYYKIPIVLQSGDFEMDVDFNAGTGKISAISGLTWLKEMTPALQSKDTPGTRLIGDVTVDATNGVFVGGDLTLTNILLKGDAQLNGYEEIPVGEIGSAKIQGMFHGNNGEGVSGIYQDVAEIEQFRGAIVGNQNAKEIYSPVIPLRDAK